MCNVLQVMLGSLGKKGREGQKVGPEVFERQGELVFRCNTLHITRGSLDMKRGGRVRKLDQRFSIGKENTRRRNASTINLGSLGGKVGNVMSFLSAEQNCREPCLLRK